MTELLKRINELAHKSKEEGLTEEEKIEQGKLREEYLENFRGRMKSTLMGVKLVDETGEDITPEKLKEEQKKYRQN